MSRVMPSQQIITSNNMHSDGTIALRERCNNKNLQQGRKKRTDAESPSGNPWLYFTQADVQLLNSLFDSGRRAAMVTPDFARPTGTDTQSPASLSDRRFKSAASGPAAQKPTQATEPAPATSTPTTEPATANKLAQATGQGEQQPSATTKNAEPAAHGGHDRSHIDHRLAENLSRSEDIDANSMRQAQAQGQGQSTMPQINRDMTMTKTTEAAEKPPATLIAQKASAARGAAAPKQGSEMTYTFKLAGQPDSHKVGINSTIETWKLTPSDPITRANLHFQLSDHSEHGRHQHQRQDDSDQAETVQLNKRGKSSEIKTAQLNKQEKFP